MQKLKDYGPVKFSSRIVRQAIDACRSLTIDEGKESLNACSISVGKEKWEFDNQEEFFAAYADERSGRPS
jgi:hypothetical protein